MCCLGGRRSENMRLPESRVECTFLQILVQSQIILGSSQGPKLSSVLPTESPVLPRRLKKVADGSYEKSSALMLRFSHAALSQPNLPSARLLLPPGVSILERVLNEIGHRRIGELSVSFAPV